MLFCPNVTQIRRNTPFWIHLKKFGDAPFIENALVLSKVIKIENFELFDIMCWAVRTEGLKVARECMLMWDTNMNFALIGQVHG